jgi:peptidoglycan/LPS O-acetylase OafA/YrhL
MTLENTPQSNSMPKIGSINTLRFIAAIFVMFYHFTFMFYHRDLTYINIPILRDLFQYGYLGVDLFFIISGFVISMSAESRNAYGFFKSRIGRLYPIFWISLILTSLFLFFAGEIINYQMTWSIFWTNATMIPAVLFGKDTAILIDGSYWTLALEMKFYFIIFVLLIFRQFKKIEWLTIPLSFIMLISAVFYNIKFDSDLIWIPNFLAGIIFYKIYKHGLNNWRIFGLCNTFIASIIFATNRIPDLVAGYKTIFSPSTITLYILLFYIIFILISLNKFRIPNNKYINILGILTYPIYLLHQQIAKILFTYAGIKNIPLYISFISVTIFIILLSFLIHKIFERRGKIAVDKILDRITPRFLKYL